GGEVPQSVARRGRARLHRLVGQVAPHVPRQGGGRFVPPGAVLLQALHHDPVQLTPHRPPELPRVRSPAPGRGRQGGRVERAQPPTPPPSLLLPHHPHPLH